jgi:hypothetical protein
MNLMMVADTEQRQEDSLQNARAAAGHLDALLASGRASHDQLLNASTISGNLAVAFMNLRHFDEGIRFSRRTVELERSSLGSRPYNLALALSSLANAQRQSGDLDGALRSIVEARSLVDRASFDNDWNRVSARYTVYWRQGVTLGGEDSISLNRPVEAAEALQTALDAVDERAAKDKDDAGVRLRVGNAARELGAVLAGRDPQRALAVYDHALARLREVKDNLRARRQEAQILAQSSYPLRRLQRAREAGARIDAALDLLQAAKVVGIAADHSDLSTRKARLCEAMRVVPSRAPRFAVLP